MISYKNQKILVTGGAGFIGGHLLDCLAKEHPQSLHVVDNLFLGREENLISARLIYPSLKFHKFDATNNKLLINLICKEKITLVFNLATKALGYSFDNPSDAFHVNVQIIGHLLEALRLKKIKHLIHFSSSEVYGTAITVPMNEKHPLQPHTTYAAGKAAADLMVYSYQKSFGLRVLTLRPFNNYGPRQNEGLYAGVIPQTIWRLLKNELPFIQGSGLQTRDFIYVSDTARIAVALAKNENLYGQVINIGTGQEIAIKDIITKLCKIMKYKGKIRNISSRPGDVKRHYADITNLKLIMKDFKLKSLDEGLNETCEWYINIFKKINNFKD